MAEPINIQIDPVHLRKQIRAVLDEEFLQFSYKLRMAADAFDPEFLKRQDEWMEKVVNDKVEARLRLKEDK